MSRHIVKTMNLEKSKMICKLERRGYFLAYIWIYDHLFFISFVPFKWIILKCHTCIISDVCGATHTHLLRFRPGGVYPSVAISVWFAAACISILPNLIRSDRIPPHSGILVILSSCCLASRRSSSWPRARQLVAWADLVTVTLMDVMELLN